ncbi:ubiquitin carboxyl-terminal hydrolase 14 [Actinocorallia aurea]
MGQTCTHLDQIEAAARPSADGCEDCLRTGGRWVHLRMCRTCGHIGCCDSSPSKHATAHFHATDHPLISSYEPGEGWSWCYIDDTGFQVQGLEDFSHP